MPMPKHYLQFSCLCILLSVCLCSCSPKDQDLESSNNVVAKTTLQKAIATKKIRIGFANESPFAYQDGASGIVTGESPEVARVVLSHLGIYEIESVLTDFGSLIPGLQAGRFDIIAAGMYILPERCEQITFSNPTYSVGESFAVRQDNPLSLHSYHDIASQPNAKLGVVSGAVEAGYASALGIPIEKMVFFPNPPSALEGIASGRVDAYAGTRLTIKNLLEKDASGLEVAAPFDDPVIEGQKVRGYGAFGFRKKDQDLVGAFNAELKNFIGTREHLNVVRRFGFDEYDLPGSVTAAELCRAPTGKAK